MNNYKSSNGRIDIINKTQGPDISNLFAIYDKIPANQCATFREPTLGQWDETPLSKTYFSKENIQIIQNGIRLGVYQKSNNQYIVAPQDCDALKIIMRSVFLQHATNQPQNISGQISYRLFIGTTPLTKFTLTTKFAVIYRDISLAKIRLNGTVQILSRVLMFNNNLST